MKKLVTLIICFSQFPILFAQSTSQVTLYRNYKIFLGLNFDFLDGIQTNNVYGEITVFKPDLSNQFLWFDHIGIHAGINEYETVSRTEDMLDRSFRYTDFTQINNDTLKRIEERANVHTVVSNKILSFYIDPLFELFKSNKLYFSIHAQLFYDNETTAYTYSAIYKKTLQQISLNDVDSTDISELSKKPPTQKNQKVIGEFGPALLLNFSDDKAEVNLKIGYCWSYFNAPLKHNWVLQFYIVDNAETGISLGGEVRWFESKLFDTENFTKPAYAINISKVFGLEQLGDFFRKKKTGS